MCYIHVVCSFYVYRTENNPSKEPHFEGLLIVKQVDLLTVTNEVVDWLNYPANILSSAVEVHTVTYFHFFNFFISPPQKFSNKDGQVLYALYGIVEHSGRLQFGHYTSFIKVRQPSQMLYLHTMKIPRGLNLLQASSSIGKKPHGADKRRHPKNNSPSVSESNVALHSQQPNGVLPTAGEHVGETDSQSPHIGNIPENGSGGLGQFPLASGEKEANPKGKWYYISDTHVSEVSESKVLNAQAYLLFYERIL